jgi:predicted phage terminase large subunit-like protein
MGVFKAIAAQNDKNDQYALARNSFWEYCKLINPSFFKESRPFQKILCDTLQRMYEKELINPRTKKPYDRLIINLPPGHGKSYTAIMFSTWVFGQSIKNQIISVSYNQTLSSRFAKAVKEHIEDTEIAGDKSYHVATSVFPGLKIKEGDGAAAVWTLEGAYMSYLATSFDGSITGMRGNVGIIDDPIKNKDEAVNERVKEAHWDWYKNTFLSRMLEGAMQVIIMTRWATDDLAGKIIAGFPDQTYVLEMPVLDANNNPLCEEILSLEGIRDKEKGIDDDIFQANYMQKPIDKKGLLYGTFKTYDVIDTDAFERVINYTDTADLGADYLCSISGGVIGRYGYITDVYYTDKGMEVTEPETARRLDLHGVRQAIIESNNGGRGFARNVISWLRKLKNGKCTVKWFHQGKNKRTRIIVNSSNVMEQIIFPADWQTRWPEFAKHIKNYQRKGDNAHDDAEDALTGFVEFLNGEIKGAGKWGWGK